MAFNGLSQFLGSDAKDFVPLDKDTKSGYPGRPLYIDSTLANKFAGIDNKDMKLIFYKLKQLKATAGDISSYSSTNDSMEHMTVIGKIRVNYKMSQNLLGGAVFITDIDLSSFTDGAPGLYDVRFKGNRWNVSEKEASSIDSHFAAINGLGKDLEQVGSEIIPPMLEGAYKDKKWGGDLKHEGYSLFYNPPSLYTKGMRFITPKQKAASQEHTAKYLRDVLVDTTKPVQWIVHGDGTKLLEQALDMVSGKDLSNHTMLLLSPMSRVSNLLPKMANCKIALHDDVTKVHADDWRSKKVQLGSGSSLAKAIKNYPGYADGNSIVAMRQAEIHRRNIKNDNFAMAGSVLSSLGVGAGVIAATATAPGAIATLSAGAFVMPSMSVAGVAAAAGTASSFVLGAFSKLRKAEQIRNSAATNLKNPSLNPHMNPFKSSDDLSVDIELHSGGKMKSFWDVIASKYLRRA